MQTTQNVYDTEEFFANYARLPRSVKGLDGAPEWPALRALLPELRGRRVLDLGCGYGWFCRWARDAGASQVVGIDVSEKMLARAGAYPADPALTYRRADLETVELPPHSFDVVFSSLAFHYVARLDRLLTQVHRALAAGGFLVFSAEHPIYSAPAQPQWLDGPSGRTWPVDHYLDEGARSRDWLAAGVVKYHRTIASHVNLLIGLGFSLSQLVEWGPTDAQIVAQPELGDERHRPMFMLFAAHRR